MGDPDPRQSTLGNLVEFVPVEKDMNMLPLSHFGDPVGAGDLANHTI